MSKEMLKLAAQAFGVPQGSRRAGHGLLMPNDLYWNPLIDDGEALRLAAKLGLQITFCDGEVSAGLVGKGVQVAYINDADDVYEATRLVIVLAAAEIGKNQ